LFEDNPPSPGEPVVVPDEEPDKYQLIFQHWIERGNLTKSPKLTDEMKRRINGKLKDGYTVEDILKAITNYSRVIASPDHYWTHKWNLGLFLGREGGFPTFTDEADPLNNYRNREDRTTTKQPAVRRKEMGYREVCYQCGNIYDSTVHTECPMCVEKREWDAIRDQSLAMR